MLGGSEKSRRSGHRPEKVSSKGEVGQQGTRVTEREKNLRHSGLDLSTVAMQAEEVERWKLKIRNSSMAILKDVQKLLTYSRDGDSEKIASTSTEIAANARELIDTIQEQVSNRTEAGKQVLATMEQTKKSIVVTMKACESISANSTEAEQNALKEECKVVAGNIKLIHQHASALKPSDFVRDESDSEDALQAGGVVSPRFKEVLHKVADHASQALNSLKGLEAAAIGKDQPQLVAHARELSGQCSELLQHGRRYKFESLVRAFRSYYRLVIQFGDILSWNERYWTAIYATS